MSNIVYLLKAVNKEDHEPIREPRDVEPTTLGGIAAEECKQSVQ
jgi:hypothetical protein